MLQKTENKAKKAKIVYLAGIAVLLFLSGFAVYDMFSGGSPVNGYVLMVVIVNIAVFGMRACFVVCNRELFSKDNYRATEQAANAERVALYAFIVIFGAGRILEIAGDNWNMDTSVGDVGKSVGILILVAPVVTYLTSGYGKFRDIVRESKNDRANEKVEAQSDD